MTDIDGTIDGIKDAVAEESKGNEKEAAVAVAALELLRIFLTDIRRIADAAEKMVQK